MGRLACAQAPCLRPGGFEVDLVCPNKRYINDEEICQAVSAMWARTLGDFMQRHLVAQYVRLIPPNISMVITLFVLCPKFRRGK